MGSKGSSKDFEWESTARRTSACRSGSSGGKWEMRLEVGGGGRRDMVSKLSQSALEESVARPFC